MPHGHEKRVAIPVYREAELLSFQLTQDHVNCREIKSREPRRIVLQRPNVGVRVAGSYYFFLVVCTLAIRTRH